VAPRIELRHLRYFVAVAEELHFRRAAERLHMSQPPLSQQIQALERELGVELLVRSRRRVELTSAGRRMLVEARRILAAVDDAVAAVARVAAGEEGRLAVGFVGSAMYGVFPQIIRGFRERHPGVELELRELSTAQQLEDLHDRKLQIGVVRPPEADRELATLQIADERVIVAMPAAHRLAGRKRIRLRDLDGESFVAMDQRTAPGLRARLLEARAEIGTATIVQETAEMQTLIGLVAAGLGVALVPGSVQALARDDVVYCPIDGWAPSVDLSLAWRHDDDSPLTRNFVAVARDAA
jgi:DNA-binding transcriptional LysR family regulator